MTYQDLKIWGCQNRDSLKGVESESETTTTTAAATIATTTTTIKTNKLYWVKHNWNQPCFCEKLLVKCLMVSN